MNVMNGRKIACDRIENVCFEFGLIAILSYEPEVLLNGWKFEARINILEVKCDIDLH